MRRCVVVVGAVLGTGLAAMAEGPSTGDQARDILKQSAAAIKKLDRVEYQARYHGTEWIKQFVPSIEGSVVVGKQSQHEINRFFCRVTLKPNDSEETLELTAGSDGDQFFLIDPKTKKAHLDMDPAVLGTQGRNIQRVVLSDLAAPEPYEDALEAETVKLEGSETIEGQECHAIRVIGDEPPERVYYIAKSDLLPRRVVRIFKNDKDEKGTTELTLAALKPNPSEPKNPFVLQVPPGFEKTDEFAP